MIDITGGDILVGGRSVKDRDVDDLRREIGYVIQQIGLFPHRTIGDNIATVPKLLGWDKQRIGARVEELLDLIGLPQEMRTRYPAQLSGGQRQRVGVARALAADPPLMLMDEPFGAIDPINRDRLQNEFLRLQAEIKQDDRLRHPRHRRGDQDGRPDRDPAGRRQARPVRAARRAAAAPRERVRGGLRRRRPRAQAALADAGLRHPARGARPRSAAASTIPEDTPLARRAVGAARPRRARTAAWSTPTATRSARSPSTRSRAWRTESGCDRHVLAQLKIRDGEDGETVLRRGQRLLPELDRRQPRALQAAADRAHRADADRGRDRLRDRVLARADRPPAALADPADHPDHRHPLHAAERRGVLPAAAADRPRQD